MLIFTYLTSPSRFNPSRGIAIIQTEVRALFEAAYAGFNPSRGIAIIQTNKGPWAGMAITLFQSLTRDSNHSNAIAESYENH